MSDKQKALRQLDAHRMVSKEQETIDYWATVEEGTTREEMRNPAFWAHCAAKLKPYFFVHVRCDDGTFYAKGIVLQVDRTWAVVHILDWYDLTTKDVAQSQAAATQMGTAADAFEIVYKGPHRKFVVIRKADQAAVQETLKDKATAVMWLAEYLKSFATTA